MTKIKLRCSEYGRFILLSVPYRAFTYDSSHSRERYCTTVFVPMTWNPCPVLRRRSHFSLLHRHTASSVTRRSVIPPSRRPEAGFGTWALSYAHIVEEDSMQEQPTEEHGHDRKPRQEPHPSRQMDRMLGHSGQVLWKEKDT